MKQRAVLALLLALMLAMSGALVIAESGPDSGSSSSGSSSGSGSSGSSGSGSGSGTGTDSAVSAGVKTPAANADVKTEARVRVETRENGTRTRIEERREQRGDEIRERREVRVEERASGNDERAKRIAEFRVRIKENGRLRIEGKEITVKELSPERKEIIAGKINARTGLNLTVEDIGNGSTGAILRAYLSNGRHALVKVMPDHASAVALARLRAKCSGRNCSLELKEVGAGNKTRLAYVIETEKDSRLFFIFKNKMVVKAEVDAETGELIATKKPWWAFLAREPPVSDAEINVSAAGVGTSASANVSANLTANASVNVSA